MILHNWFPYIYINYYFLSFQYLSPQNKKFKMLIKSANKIYVIRHDKKYCPAFKNWGSLLLVFLVLLVFNNNNLKLTDVYKSRYKPGLLPMTWWVWSTGMNYFGVNIHTFLLFLEFFTKIKILWTSKPGQTDTWMNKGKWICPHSDFHHRA